MFKLEILAENIRKCRIKHGLTQNELAEKLFLSSQAVSKWESGQSVPDISNLMLLSEIFSISVDMLIGNADCRETKAYIGVDGGATKTEFILFSENGKIIKRIVSKGSNPNSVGIDTAMSVLKRGIDSLLAIRSDVKGIFIGVAGYSSGNNSTVLRKFFNKSYPLLNIELGNDILNVFDSVPDIHNAIAVICGTGFSIFCQTSDELRRVGGWGYLLDEYSGGFALGKKVLAAALAQRDGFGEKTIMTTLAEQKLGKGVWESMDVIYKGGNSFIATFAPIVFEAYKKGDALAEKVLKEYTQEIARLIDYSVTTYKCKNVILSGSLFSKDNILTSLLKQECKAKVNFVIPELPQIYGACHKCISLYGEKSDDFYENFKTYYGSQSIQT